MAVEVEIRWPDIDEYGHVSHIALVAIAEHGRSRWLDATLGIEPETWPYVVAHLELDFRAPAVFVDRWLHCDFTAQRVGTTSVTLRERYTRPNGDLVMEAESVIVAWDKGSSASRPLSPEEADRLTAAATDPR
ncbi:MAG TPA: acyl-CoA thioesterase [Solirubrobacterales bacterium]|nr:acyl-CoA thioesterase [Solirubrobacterales bacterium]